MPQKTRRGHRVIEQARPWPLTVQPLRIAKPVEFDGIGGSPSMGSGRKPLGVMRGEAAGQEQNLPSGLIDADALHQ